jgi:fumarate reductase subunit C
VKRWSHLAFILRELSSLFIVWFVVYLLLMVRAVFATNRYQEFLEWSAKPAILVVNFVGLVFVLFHAITWFNLAPKAMVVRLGGKRVPGSWIAASNYLALAVVSALIAVLILDA